MSENKIINIMPYKIKDKDILKIVKQSKKPLSPVFEALQNSLESIKDKNILNNNDFINITLKYKKPNTLFETELEHIELEYIEIEDSGQGFDDKNLDRFQSIFDTSKGFNNKGTGKLQMFYRFEDIEIKSVPFDTATGIYFTASRFTNNGESSPYTNDIKHTIVKFVKPKQSTIKEYDSYQDIEKLKNDILAEFFVQFSLADYVPKITIKVMNEEKEKFIEISKNDLQKPEQSLPFKVKKVIPSEDLPCDEWTESHTEIEFSCKRFKFTNQFINKNEVYICSKDIPVEKRQIKEINKTTSFGNSFYIIAITSDFLNNVELLNNDRTKFTIPTRYEWQNSNDVFKNLDEQIFYDDVNDEIEKITIDILDDIHNLKQKKQENIAKMANLYHIHNDVVKSADRKIRLNDTQEQILAKLYTSEASILKNHDIELTKAIEEIEELNPIDDNYETNLQQIANKITTLIPKQNCIQLGNYIARREVTIRLFDKILQDGLKIQKEWKDKKEDGEKIRKENEALIHDILIKRKETGEELDNNLWFFGEEFSHFKYISSDIPFKEIKINNEFLFKRGVDLDSELEKIKIKKEERRPDILIFKETGEVIIFELKAHNIQLTEHLNQIEKYAKFIANFSNIEFKQFYGFLIGEEIDRADMSGNFRLKGDNQGWFNPHTEIVSFTDYRTPIASLYQEILKISEISRIAKIRNKSFAEKLGIRRNDKIESSKIISEKNTSKVKKQQSQSEEKQKRPNSLKPFATTLQTQYHS